MSRTRAAETSIHALSPEVWAFWTACCRAWIWAWVAGAEVAGGVPCARRKPEEARKTQRNRGRTRLRHIDFPLPICVESMKDEVVERRFDVPLEFQTHGASHREFN
jgi:hypothetical protein